MKFDIEYQARCRYDYVTITDGDGTILLEKTCGNIVPMDIRSKTNQAFVFFHTDEYMAESGWKLEWKPLTGKEEQGASSSSFVLF